MKSLINFIQPIIIRPSDTTETIEVVRYQSNIDICKNDKGIFLLFILLSIFLILCTKLYINLLK